MSIDPTTTGRTLWCRKPGAQGLPSPVGGPCHSGRRWLPGPDFPDRRTEAPVPARRFPQSVPGPALRQPLPCAGSCVSPTRLSAEQLGVRGQMRRWCRGLMPSPAEVSCGMPPGTGRPLRLRLPRGWLPCGRQPREWLTWEALVWWMPELRPARLRLPESLRLPAPGLRLPAPEAQGLPAARQGRSQPLPQAHAQRPGPRPAWWAQPQRVMPEWVPLRWGSPSWRVLLGWGSPSWLVPGIRWVGPDGVRLAWCARARVARGVGYPWLGTWLCLSTPARLAVGFGRGRPAARGGFTPRACGENKPGKLWVPRLCRGSGGSWIAAEPGVNPEAAQRRSGRPTTVQEAESKVTLM